VSLTQVSRCGHDKHGREFIITIKYNSDNNDPNDVTELQEKLEDTSIKQTQGEQQL
jgi:hypothetical protein